METETKKVDLKKVFITISLVILAALTVGGGVYYVLNNNMKKEREANENALNKVRDELQEKVAKSQSEKPTEQNQSKIPEEEIIPHYAKDWYKFISPNYGFTFRYPKMGVDALQPSLPPKACSQPLTVSNEMESDWFRENGYSAFWTYGNFFGIAVRPVGDGISAHIKSTDPTGIHRYHSININGAKEAVKFDTELNRQIEGYPPFAYTRYILNDGKNLYSVMGFQALPNDKECAGPFVGGDVDEIINTFNF